MSLTKFSVNTNVIENLPDAPNLSSDQLKQKFDEVGMGIKDYINNILTNEIETLVATEKATLQTIIKDEKTVLLTSIEEKILEDNKKKYYIGKIIMDTKDINPSSYLGFGTWQKWGQGKVPVGVSLNDTEFNTVEKTGGEKSHVLSEGEMPRHTHVNGTIYATTPGMGTAPGVAVSGGSGGVNKYYEHDAPTGGNWAHNNLQPYITCYMWKRIA